MDFQGLLANLSLGFGVSLTPTNLLYCLAGAVVGTLVGVLPGLGPVATVAMLMPLTFYAPPAGALIMLAGIYYGAQYGGSTTAILINLPGESSSVATCLDGYKLAQQGRAGAALAVAALASLFAGCVATLFIVLLAAPLSSVALLFGPAEYFWLAMLGLIAAIVLAQGSLLKAFAMMVAGLVLSMVGTDTVTGAQRMTFGTTELMDGIGFVPLGMGLFAIAEIIKNIESPEQRSVVAKRVTGLWPTGDDFRRSWPATLRGTMIGSLLGVLPGGGAMLASFSAYVLEKRLSRQQGRFGNGAIEGVAAPEAANNAGAQMSFIPLLTLGVPSNAVMALMAGSMVLQGIQPGPQVMTRNPDLFWGLIASMWIGNVMLVIINLPLIRIWVTILRVPYRLLYLAILMFCFVGTYTINNNYFDVVLLAVFGLAGYVLSKFDCEPAPLLLAFVLGPLMEENFRTAMLLSRGSLLIFVESPVSVSLIGVAVALVAITLLPSVRRRREEAL